MKFNHRVKHNGVVYPAGAEVPVADAVVPINENVVSEEKKKPEPKAEKTKVGNKRTKK